MVTRGGDGGEMPGMDEPILELPLGEIGMAGLAPTLIVMQNLPSIASLASSLASFILSNDLTDELRQWMRRAMCEKHRHEMPDDIPKILTTYKAVIDNYLTSLGLQAEDPCDHDHKGMEKE
jgi:hypothetical protein